MKIYQPLTNLDKIHFPSHDTEADLQAQLYAKLVKDGFTIKAGLNYRLSNPGAGCSLDLVVFKEKRPLVILELKNRIEGPTTDLDSTRQGLKYRQFGIPVILFWTMSDYPALLEYLQSGKIQPEREIINSKNPDLLKRLHHSLDIASMAAYDLGMNELVTDLEAKRDRVMEMLND